MEKDLLGQAVDETAQLLRESREAIRAFPLLGPLRVKMSTRELRRMAETNPGFMAQLASAGTSGAQQALEMIFGSQNMGARDPQEFAREKERNG